MFIFVQDSRQIFTRRVEVGHERECCHDSQYIGRITSRGGNLVNDSKQFVDPLLSLRLSLVVFCEAGYLQAKEINEHIGGYQLVTY